MKYDRFDNILSNKAKKNKGMADEKPYFDNTHDTLGLYKNPKPKEDEDENEDENGEKGRPKGFALLKRIYGGGTDFANNPLKAKRVVDNYSDVVNHLDEHLREKAGDPTDAKQSKHLKDEIKQINASQLTPANKVGKNDPLYRVSNPKEVQRKAFEIYGKDAVVYKSDKPNKKYRLMDTLTGKTVYFGDAQMEDFTKHQDADRRQSYLARALNIKGKWRQNPYSPNILSLVLLWDAE